ncbi:DUF7931 domain-containing protein [Pseudothauera rhizosphaerae]|uniref:DUF7931 domain-containing protein n=1 Tax=Pseudothauera rhizosphaerae TaxID=2565932 RepID=A0A4S4AW09_9RHOO|nr:hypothetical protein [Pseudothauera rhizosphaerae]THF64209.1 hypothetical protein E6O51_02480 [Pseudothauera rhizosphaerae]
MSDTTEQTFDTYAAYRAALLDAVERAERTIVLFDPDLGETGLESPAGAEAVGRFLRQASGEDCLRVLLASTDLLDKHSPRLLHLLATHAHRFAVRIGSGETLQPQPQPFAVVDGKHLVTRFHRDRPRGKASLDAPADCAPFFAQFETMWINAQPAQSGATLGI